MEINMDPRHKQMLDDVFDAFTMLAEGAIISLMHVEGGFTRYTANGVDLLDLPGEYIPNGAMNWNDWLHPEDRKRYMDVMMPLIEGKVHTYDITYRVRIKTGEYVSFRAVGAVLRSENGDPALIGGALINQGLTEKVDPVTILPNKVSFLQDVNNYIKSETNFISLKIHLGKFTEIMNRQGYSYGNRLLQEISWMISDAIKNRATLYRMTGASFALITTTISKEEVAAIYDNIRYRLQKGIEVNGTKNTLFASGATISAYGSDTNADTILSCLNYACEESKLHMHGDLVDYNGSINYDEARSLRLLSRIRSNIMDNCKNFYMEYLPVIDARAETINGAEAIIAWQDEEFGQVSYEDFLPLLERDYIFEELADYIIKQSLEDGVKLLTRDPGFLLCINVYRIQMESDYFVDNLMYYIEETGFPAKLISLKLSSDCRSIDPVHLSATIEKLREKDIIVILDGFGAGSNSIVTLKNIPLDAVSIDRQFVRGIEDQDRDFGILEHLVSMASNCVRHINIPDVGTDKLRQIVRKFPITTLQGEYYSGPLELDGLIDKYYS